mgnify:CR=1 FL=1
MVHVYKPRVAVKITLADSEAAELRIRKIDVESKSLRRDTAAKLKLLRVEKTSLKAWLLRHERKINELVDEANGMDEDSEEDAGVAVSLSPEALEHARRTIFNS